MEQVALQVKERVCLLDDLADVAEIACNDAFSDMFYEQMNRWDEKRSMP